MTRLSSLPACSLASPLSPFTPLWCCWAGEGSGDKLGVPPAGAAPLAAISPPILSPRSVVKDLWAAPKCRAVAASEAQERRSRVALTVTWMAATLGIALFVPDIGKVIELIGGISAFFIFIFPGKSRHGDTGASLQGKGACPGPILGVQSCACGGQCSGAG